MAIERITRLHDREVLRTPYDLTNSFTFICLAS